MNIVFTTGYREEYWGDWPWSPRMYGGSEHLLIELACELAAEHDVFVRLPRRDVTSRMWRGVYWHGGRHPAHRADVLFSFDDFNPVDTAIRTVLVACRSDPPPHTDFDRMIFLSPTHARLMGHSDSPSIGGGVRLSDYEEEEERAPRRVICTASPDRCRAAPAIGRGYDFVHSYRSVPGLPPTLELDRPSLVRLQKTARVYIYPLDPVRPSDFFSMATLEAMAAGTPAIVSSADSMAELWDGAAIVLPRPIDLGEWDETVSDLIDNTARWRKQSRLGRLRAADYDWSKVAQRYLKEATR